MLGLLLNVTHTDGPAGCNDDDDSDNDAGFGGGVDDDLFSKFC